MTILVKPEPLPPEGWKRRAFLVVACPPIVASRESLAHHEAGHAVAALMLGLPCFGASLGDDRGWFMTHPAMQEASPETMTEEDSAEFHLLAAKVENPASNDVDRTIDLVTMMAAGVQAELILAGHPWPGAVRRNDLDTRQASYLLAASGNPASLGYCQLRARSLLTQQWAQVQSIAADLVASGVWQR